MRPLRIALTGGIASGKSLCLVTFARLGAPTIDADQLAREALAPGSAGAAAVIARFGAALSRADGTLDRKALGALAFADADARRDLEAIVHPQVYAAIESWFATLQAPAGIADIPLLYETGRSAHFDIVVVASCRPDQQLTRLMARDGLTEPDARARIAAQWPLADKAARADHVIDTSGSVEQTMTRTEDVWGNLQSVIANW